DFDETLFQLEHVIDLTFHVARRSLRASGNLMDHDIGIWKRETLALRSRTEQHRSHACSHPEAIGRHIACEKLHRIINRQARSDRAARRIDIDVNVLFRVLNLQKQQLGNHKISDVIIHRRSDEDDAILEQSRVNIIAALASARLLHDHRNQHLGGIFVRYTPDFSSLPAGSCAASTLTFALRKSRVLPSRICSANASRPSCSCSSLRIFSMGTLYRAASSRSRALMSSRATLMFSRSAIRCRMKLVFNR